MTYREQLAEAMVPIAMELAFTVRTGTAADVEKVLSGVHRVHLPALCVVLAAAIDIDRPETELFGWTAGHVPSRDPLAPITEQEAAENRAELAAALGATDKESAA